MLSVPYAAQIDDGACLPACAQMVLAYLGRSVKQAQLIRLLGTTDAGTPFSRLRLLSQFGIEVDLHTDGTLAELRGRLPAIVALHSDWLSDQQVTGQHAVVIVAMDDSNVTVLDPAKDKNPVQLSNDEFLAAWIEMDSVFAVFHPYI